MFNIYSMDPISFTINGELYQGKLKIDNILMLINSNFFSYTLYELDILEFIFRLIIYI